MTDIIKKMYQDILDENNLAWWDLSFDDYLKSLKDIKKLEGE